MWQLAALIGAGLGLWKSEYGAEGINNKLCVLCKKYYGRYGHNAEPLAKGRCCDDCNDKVIAARMAMYFGAEIEDATSEVIPPTPPTSDLIKKGYMGTGASVQGYVTDWIPATWNAESVIEHKRGKVISMRGSDPRLRTLRKDKDISPKEARDRLEISAESELFKDEYHDDENKCDRCGSEEILHEDIGHYMYQYECRDCDYKWIEEYDIDYIDYNNAETFEADYYYGLGDYYEEDPDLWEHRDKYKIRHRVRDAILKMPTDKAWEYIIWIDSQDGAISEEENEAWETALANKDLEAALQNLIIERGYINEGWGTGIINELKDHNYYQAETFNAAVLHKKPKGYVGKAVAMDALMTQARIEEAMLQLETAVKLGLISEDEIMEKLQQQFGSEEYAGNYMVPADIKSLARSVKVLQSKARADQNQPEWWKSKLSVVAAELDDLTDFFDYAEDTGML